MPRTPYPYDELAPLSQWRKGDRSDAPRIAHNEHSRTARRQKVREHFAPFEGALIGDLASGMPLRDAAEKHGVSIQAIHQRKIWDEVWSVRLNAALTAGRDPSLRHGIPGSYKLGCRCPECREAHNASRK